MDNIRPTLEAAMREHASRQSAQEKALADARRESDALLTLKLRGQVDDETFERRRLGLLDHQARLQLQLEQPVHKPDDLLARLGKVLSFSVSLPRAFREGDPVRRRQIFQTICANPTVKDRKALYQAKEPWSFFQGSGLTNQWCATWSEIWKWIQFGAGSTDSCAMEPDVILPETYVPA